MCFDCVIGGFYSKFIPLVLALIGFGLLIAIHEFGHFIFCKIFGIHTPVFSIGFGPEIYRKKIGKTDFRLAIIPFGGYVEIAGLAEIGQGEQEHAEITGPESFANKYFWQKALVLLGGIIMNFLFAYIIFCALFMVGTKQGTNGVIVTNLVKDSAAEKSGLKPGDGILSINNQTLLSSENEILTNSQQILLQNIKSNPNKEVIFKIERNGKAFELPVVLASRQENNNQIGMLGAGLASPIPQLPFFQAIAQGIETTNTWIVEILNGLKSFFVRRSLDGAGGPLMIISQSFTSAQYGILPLLTFLALISLNLAIFNLLPLVVTDGGQLLFAVIEFIIRRRIPETFKLIVSLISWLLLIGLALYLTHKDIDVLTGGKLSALYQKIAAYCCR